VVGLSLIFISGCSGSRENSSPDSGAVEMLSTPLVSTSTLEPMSAFQIAQVNAGEINDNAQWDTYLNYRNAYLETYISSVRNVDVSERRIITVTDAKGLPVQGASVLVFSGDSLVSQTQTYTNGQTLFFPKARAEAGDVQSFRVIAQKNDTAVEFTLDAQSQSSTTVMLKEIDTQNQNTPLDVLFLLDATGSMADEIAQLQNNILGISEQVGKITSSDNVHYGLVAYRDRGDDYVTRVYDFTPDVAVFQANLNMVEADGGGDIPESLNEALHNAVQDVQWRGDDTVKLIFLVADAPPHLDYANDYDYVEEVAIAAANGIKIHPIASSGLKPDGEFILRQIAQYTMGHFLFLTYQQGSSGAAGDSRTDLEVGDPIDPQTQQGDYTVEQLDDLVLQLIKNEMAALSIPVVDKPNVQSKVIQPLPVMDVPLPQIVQPVIAAPVATNSYPAATVTSAPIFNLNLLFTVAIVVIAVLIMMIAHLMNTRQSIYKEKRKNDDLEIKIDA
jgi:hypothetical protein